MIELTRFTSHRNPRVFVAGFLMLAVGLASTPANTATRSADDLKAAFLYQFTRFVEWPSGAFEDSSTPYVICVVGDSAVYGAIEEIIDGKEVDGRALEATYHPQRGAARLGSDEDHRCHLLFMPELEAPQISEMHDPIEDGTILTVGDTDSFTSRGGVIRLYEQENKVRIEINIDAANRSSLKISSKLLGLANVVHDDGVAED